MDNVKYYEIKGQVDFYQAHGDGKASRLCLSPSPAILVLSKPIQEVYIYVISL